MSVTRVRSIGAQLSKIMCYIILSIVMSLKAPRDVGILSKEPSDVPRYWDVDEIHNKNLDCDTEYLLVICTQIVASNTI